MAFISRAKQQQYYLYNKEKINAYGRAYYKNNSEHLKANKRNRYEAKHGKKRTKSEKQESLRKIQLARLVDACIDAVEKIDKRRRSRMTVSIERKERWRNLRKDLEKLRMKIAA